MNKLLCFFTVFILAVRAQENGLRVLSPFVQDCYENKYLLERDNRLPHTLNTLIAILRKIEDDKNLNMDIRSLSITLLHRYRQDGIILNPNIQFQDGVIPFAPNGYQFFQFAHLLHLIPGNGMSIPNNTLTDIERCTLHFMLSSGTEKCKRGDEGKVCRFATKAYRNIRSAKNTSTTMSKNITDDVETFSPVEIESKTKHKSSGRTNTVDPSSLYPEYPINHPRFAQLYSAESECPVENGVVKTAWGAVSFGFVLAGIAAGLQPETATLRDLQSDDSKVKLPVDLIIDNKWLATLSANLAEVALIQGPLQKKFVVGVGGNWNSTILPRWYFLSDKTNDEMTLAEIRGGLDGLILANQMQKLYSNIRNIRLSQVLDMYYSSRGLLNSEIRACNRRDLLTSVAPNETISSEAYKAALLLNAHLAEATLDDIAIKKFAVAATNELLVFIPSSMNNDLTCRETDRLDDFHQLSVDLTIIVDTKWPFNEIQLILAKILDNMEINKFNSNFTLVNGNDGLPIINSTFDITDFLSFNSSHYENVTHGFDLPKTLETLYWMQKNKLDNERSRGAGGARSEVILIVPYTSEISQQDKTYCKQRITSMREVVPDITMLILAHRSKDTWSDLVLDPTKDLFSISVDSTEQSLEPLINIISRIKQVPKRLINSQCGSTYQATGSSNSYTDYIEPHGINFYRLHPNYFFTTDTTNVPTITIQAPASHGLTVCTSRDLLQIDSTNSLTAESCSSVENEKSITVSCADASLIHQCPPVYILIRANSTIRTSECTDNEVCRFPHLIKYTISYKNLMCVNSAMKTIFSPIILVLTLTYLTHLNV